MTISARDRKAANGLSGDELRGTANRRYSGSIFHNWTKGRLNRDVVIAGVVLLSGDSLLFAPGRGKSVKAWSPLVEASHFFILPVSHVIADEEERNEGWDE